MKDGVDLLQTQPPVLFGRGIRYFAGFGLILAYSLVVPLKIKGFLPTTVTWTGVVLIPGLMFSSLGSFLILPVATVRQRIIMAAFSYGCLGTGLGLVYWQGWH